MAIDAYADQRESGESVWTGTPELQRVLLVLSVSAILIGPVLVGAFTGWFLTVEHDRRSGAVSQSAPLVTNSELTAVGVSPDAASAILIQG